MFSSIIFVSTRWTPCTHVSLNAVFGFWKSVYEEEIGE